MQFLADENIQAPTIRFLRELGYDVKGVKDVGLDAAPDDDVFAHAQTEHRILLTFNADFADLRDLGGKMHAGIVRLRVSNQRAAHLHPILQAAMRCLAETDLKNTLVTISDRRTRLRKTSSA